MLFLTLVALFFKQNFFKYGLHFRYHRRNFKKLLQKYCAQEKYFYNKYVWRKFSIKKLFLVTFLNQKSFRGTKSRRYPQIQSGIENSK
jgi:hypothetical protein